MKKFAAPSCQDCPHRKGPLMGCCHAEELNFIAGHKLTQSYQKGQGIFHEGTPAVGLYCVSQGKIKITKSGGDGKEQIIRLATGGDMLGFHSLLTEENYSSSAVAMDDCVVCFIPRSDFFRVWQSNLQLSTSLMQMLAKSLSEAEVQMLHLAYRPVRERLAEALLLLYRTFWQEDDLEPFSMAISREELASLVGTVRETATRLLTEFKDEGIIATRGSQITILSIDSLLEISSFYD